MGKKVIHFVGGVCLLFSAPLRAHAWVPNITHDLTLSETCRPEYLEDGLLAKNGDMPEIQGFTADFFKRCERQFRLRSKSPWLTMLSMPELEYDFDERSGIKRVEFVDHRDEVVRPGFLALQPGNRPRPLIIFQCGVLCNLRDASMKSIFIGLYDTGIFHVLALPSSTGSDYQRQNGIMALGGVDEGRQLMRIALMLKSPGFPYANRISDVHMIGASLGGHAALYGSLYADYYENSGHRKAFNSVMAACPVVRLQESIENITRNSLIGRVFYSTFVSQIMDVFEDIPVLKSLIRRDRSFRPKYAELRDIIANGALDYYKNRTRDPSWALPPLQDTRIATLNDLWRVNNFVEYGYAQKKTPVFVWTSADDPVVKYDQNAGALINQDKDALDHKIYSLVMPRGNHCMYEASYGWQTAGAMFRGYFLSGSPEFARRRRRENLSLPTTRIPEPFRVRPWEKRTTVYWSVNSETKAIQLISDFRGQDCVPDGKRHNTLCHRRAAMNFDYDELNLGEPPENRPELLALERRLNTNYRIYESGGHYLSTAGDPAKIEMLNY